ncbi:protein required for cell viability [Aspergillus heteromorphus CBS 117.55]|uniref:Protein required for cell viability n=1 Tax=Aspergillus heteromorphus CBS 117.55 TaxID=1448321 RepID=A0A317V2E5_9EURO|nr:protein required for cell viability [Aspergillus heteromorphus CBS 117.55]PWY68453.1 protein required for cell viability [Aspergillus heteromorphus CBS 117.55]
MGDSIRIKEAFAEASEFLNPVLQRDEIHKSRGKSLLEILGEAQCDENEQKGIELIRREVIAKALDILSRIHIAFVAPPNDVESSIQDGKDTEDAALEDAKRRRMLHALLDLISLEGIYPSLSKGVCIPLQQRVISVLPAGVIAQQQQVRAHDQPEDELLLGNIWSALSKVTFDVRPSIQPVVRGRILSDIISAVSDLAYNSRTLSDDKKDECGRDLVRIIEETPSPILLSTLSNFLQSDPAPWFRSIVSSQLSQIPLRPGGVVQTMVFLASQLAPSLGNEAHSQASHGPVFTVQAIMQTSRLLSSVPQGMDPKVYFSNIAPQLLSLIDGDDPDLRKTAAYVIGNGILGKRAYGAPGTIGHSIFLEPIFKALTAGIDAASKPWIAPNDDEHDASEQILVNDSLLLRAVDRLRSLVLQPPNPSLVRRVVHPVLLPLWGLACYALEQQQTTLHEKILTVLQTYFGISVGLQPLQKLVDNLLYDGGPTWTYISDSKKHCVSLQKRNPSESNRNIVRLVDILQSRAKLFVSLLGADPSSEERTADIFLYVSESWLVKPSTGERTLDRLRLSKEEDDFSKILHKLVSAKLAETLLENFKDALSRRPLRVLELIKQIIDGELNRAYHQSKRTMGQRSGTVSLSSLANIVDPEDAGKEDAAAEADSAESLPAVFSLLSTVLASPEFTTSQETLPTLEAIKSKLEHLIPHLPSSLSKPATTASMLVEIHLTLPEGPSPSKPSPQTSDFDTHRRALANLNSDLPPIQAEGFSLLSSLITKASPVLDIPSTLTLLLTILTSPPQTPTHNDDEFTYLNAIKLTGTLASRHPRTVIKTLVDRYIDRTESNTLDQRLKIGESLTRTVQDLGEALTGETAKILAEGMIAVAGRRAHKPEAQRARKQQLEKEKRRIEREARQNREPVMPAGWSIPKIEEVTDHGDAEDEDEDSDTESPEQAAHAANIISAWAAGANSDEEPDDLRVRASALSILATAIQTNISGLGPAIISSAVDLALATLTLEADIESAILRRASVVLLLDILKALDTDRENRGSQALSFGFSLSDEMAAGGGSGGKGWNEAGSRGLTTVGNIPHMLRTLKFVESCETDVIVRGHIRVLIESLEAWLEKSLLWGMGIGVRDEEEPRLELGDRIAGLQINPLSDRSEGMRPRIEEIE